MKILIIFGTRPEAIKLFPVVNCLRAETSFNVKVCITAQHRSLLDQILTLFDLSVDYDLNLMKPNQNLTDLTARIICEVGKTLDEFQPDRILVQGDTTTAMASAMAAFYRKIPVDHVEAGLRSGNLYSPWPEELNRKVIGSLAALHFAPTARAAEALVRENIPRERVFITGNTVIDALLAAKLNGRFHLGPSGDRVASPFPFAKPPDHSGDNAQARKFRPGNSEYRLSPGSDFPAGRLHDRVPGPS